MEPVSDNAGDAWIFPGVARAVVGRQCMISGQ